MVDADDAVISGGALSVPALPEDGGLMIFERSRRDGCLRLRSIDDYVGPRPPYALRSGWSKTFYELWIYAACPKRDPWYREDAYALIAAEILDRFYSWRGIDSQWGVIRREDIFRV